MFDDDIETNEPKKSLSIWQIIYPVLAFYGANLLASFIGSFIISMKYVAEKGMEYFANTANYTVIVNELLQMLVRYEFYISIGAYVLTIPIMMLFMNKDKKASFINGTHVYYEPTPIRYYIAVLAFGAFASITANNLINLSGLVEVFQDTSDMLQEAIYGGPLWMEILMVVILAPIAEELTFRGLIFKRAREAEDFWFSAILSAFIFGLVHGNILQFIYAFALGIAMAFIYERYQNILACILFHAAANGSSLLLTETDLLKKISATDLSAIMYIAVAALMTVAILALIYEKVFPVKIELGKETSGEETDSFR